MFLSGARQQAGFGLFPQPVKLRAESELPVRRPYNAIQLAVVEPCHGTVFTRADDDIASTAVYMRVHHVSTVRAVEPLIKFLVIEWPDELRCGLTPRTQVLHQQ